MANDSGTIVTFESLVSDTSADGADKSQTPDTSIPASYELTIDDTATQAQSNAPETAEESKVENDWEAMFKATQAAYTKSRQEVAALKTKAAELEKQLDSAQIQLPQEVIDELEMLKHTDPEAWRQALNEIEAKRAKEIDSRIAQEVEATRREAILEEYNRNNPGYELNDYVAENVLPASYLKRLNEGSITFDTFVKEASEYLHKTKIGPGNSSNAGKVAPINIVDGSSSPGPSGTMLDISYSEAIF